MTTGNKYIYNYSIYPYGSWLVGGYGEPYASKRRVWSGTDGVSRVNPYDGKYTETHEGYALGSRWIRCRHVIDGVVKYFDDWEPERRFIFAFSFPNPPGGVTGAAEPAALNKLISAILQSDFQLNVALGEMPETLWYVYQKLKPLIKSFKYLRSGDIKRAFKALGIHKINGKRIKVYHLRAPAEYWLEYRYAISPMIQDINGAIERFSQDFSRSVTTRIKKSSKAYPPVHLYTSDSAYMGKLQFWPNAIIEEYSLAGCDIFAGFDYEAVDIRNPFTVAWELTPFSFVIDWVAPIGNWLRARMFFHYAQYENGFITNLLKYNTGNPKPGTIEAFYSAYDFRITGGDFYEAYQTVTVQKRRVLDANYLPSIGLKHPITGTESWARAIDALTLLESVAVGAERKYRL